MAKINYTIISIVLLFNISEARESLSIGFWNVENLFDLKDDPYKKDDEFSIGGIKNVNQKIYNLKIKNCSEVLRDLNVDILGLSEVENLKVIKDLNLSYKERNYKIIHYDSPDIRGIDNALLYDNSKFSVIESRPIKNRLNDGTLTRDILYIKGEYLENELHIFINHWPSNYGGREKAIPKRASTAKLISREIVKIMAEDNLAEIILLGDFNENPNEKNIKQLEKIGLISLMKPFLDRPKTGTNVYRGKDYLYDQVIVNEKLFDNKSLSIIKESVYILDLPKYRQQEGNYKHYPFRFWAGNKLLGGYSDHLAIKVNIIKN